MKSIIYRIARQEDIPQLVDLRVSMQLEVHDLAESSISRHYKQDVESYFKNAIRDKKYCSVVALEEADIVGTAGVCFYEKPPSISGGSGLVGYVTNVYTRPGFRGRGIGTKMMREINKLATELKADKLHLGATSDGLSIYRAAGYKEPDFVALEIRNPF